MHYDLKNKKVPGNVRRGGLWPLLTSPTAGGVSIGSEWGNSSSITTRSDSQCWLERTLLGRQQLRICRACNGLKKHRAPVRKATVLGKGREPPAGRYHKLRSAPLPHVAW